MVNMATKMSKTDITGFSIRGKDLRNWGRKPSTVKVVETGIESPEFYF